MRSGEEGSEDLAGGGIGREKGEVRSEFGWGADGDDAAFASNGS